MNPLKTNHTYAFSHLKRCLPRWLLVALPSSERFMYTLAELVKNLTCTRTFGYWVHSKHVKAATKAP